MKKILKELYTYIIIVVVVLLIKYFFVAPVRVVGPSMEHTLLNGDIMILDKISYRFNEIKRFDIVVLESEDSLIIKRIIGIPGDDIQHKENKLYIDYKTRLLISALLVVFLSITSLLITNTLLNLSNFNKIKYNEKSNIDYKVYLKENNFYEKDYLEKDKVYIASLIDKILIDFKYDFDIEKESNIKFNYEVIAKLSINDEVTGSNYYEKEYKIVDKKEERITNTKIFNLEKQVDINYSYYNSLANTFKQQYGIDTISNLNVYMKIYI